MQQNERQILSDLVIKSQPAPNLASHLQPASSFWSAFLKLVLILTRSFSTNLGFTPENFTSSCPNIGMKRVHIAESVCPEPFEKKKKERKMNNLILDMSSFHLEQLKRVNEDSETTQLNGQE